MFIPFLTIDSLESVAIQLAHDTSGAHLTGALGAWKSMTSMSSINQHSTAVGLYLDIYEILLVVAYLIVRIITEERPLVLCERLLIPRYLLFL